MYALCYPRAVCIPLFPRRLPMPDFIQVYQRTICVHVYGCLWRVLSVPPPLFHYRKLLVLKEAGS